MIIENVRKLLLRNNEHFQFNTEFRDLVVEHGAESLKVAAHFAIYLSAYNKEDEGLKRIVKSLYTEKIREADKARDEIFSGMAEIAAASLKHYAPDVREAAKKLKILFGTYGNVSAMPLNEQTSAVNNILQDLRGEYSAAAQTVGITGWADELETRNNTFETFVKGRFREAASQNGVAVKAAREEVDAAYDTIVERINALVIVEGEGAYAAFIRTLNAVVTKYNAILNGRLGKRGHRHETGEEEEPEAEPPDGLTEPPEEEAGEDGEAE